MPNEPAAPETADAFDTWLQDPRVQRAVNAFALEFALRYMREAAYLFDHDYECAVIFLSVVEANGRHNVRQPFILDEYADVRNAIPAELAVPVSRQAVAQSLGLSRETVRRKIAAMIKKGLLVADERGGVISARGAIASEAFLSAQKRVVGYVRQFRSDLRRYAGAPGP